MNRAKTSASCEVFAAEEELPLINIFLITDTFDSYRFYSGFATWLAGTIAMYIGLYIIINIALVLLFIINSIC